MGAQGQDTVIWGCPEGQSKKTIAPQGGPWRPLLRGPGITAHKKPSCCHTHLTHTVVGGGGGSGHWVHDLLHITKPWYETRH